MHNRFATLLHYTAIQWSLRAVDSHHSLITLSAGWLAIYTMGLYAFLASWQPSISSLLQSTYINVIVLRKINSLAVPECMVCLDVSTG